MRMPMGATSLVRSHHALVFPFQPLHEHSTGNLVGALVFGTLALVVSVSVGNRMDPVPLLIFVIAGGLSAFYVLKILPKVRAAEEEGLTLRDAGPTAPGCA